MDCKMLNRIVNYIFNKPRYKKYYKPLDPPTLREQKLIDELKNTFEKLSDEDGTGYSHPERIWKHNLNNLKVLFFCLVCEVYEIISLLFKQLHK